MSKELVAKELIQIANELKVADSLFYDIISPKDVMNLKKSVDEETHKLAIKVSVRLAKELTPTRDQQEAINRLKSSVSSNMSEAQHRNNIFKAAHALGIKLPSSSF